ncbi:MAG: hypothetical protein BZY80_06360 [SAR202 cluster bacterium Io17-Chloro-G2]|nr:MAG: hypothetical protein BZY80_06360 [SAR202 cluster bacterium Io17-Chloro-G2]
MLAAVLLAAACSSGDALTSAPPVTRLSETGAGEMGGPQFSAVIITTDLAVGPNRVVFGLVDREGMPVRPGEAQVNAVFLDPEEKTADVRATSMARFQEWPVGDQGVLTTELSLDKPGFWRLNVEATAADGTAINARGAFQVKGVSDTPAVGQAAPRTVTLTIDTANDLATITSANPPDPDLYRLSVDEALDSGKPLVLVFSTPAFCASATCGPQVEVISQVKEKYQDRANFIHVEVFKDPHLIEGGRPVGGTVPAVTEWNLPTEPWTFVIDGEGRVRAKFEQFTTAQEIEAALLDLL